ncbi:cation efflux family protein [Ostertagia ostertagi]
MFSIEEKQCGGEQSDHQQLAITNELSGLNFRGAISRRKSKRNGFGWVRAEVLGALVNGVFLLAMCFAISLESIGRLIHSRRITHPLQVLIVGCIGLFINMIGIGMFHGGHGHSHGGGGHGHSHGEKSSKSKDESASIVKKSDEEAKDVDDDEFDSDSDPAFVTRPGRSRSRIGQDCSHNLSLIVGSGSKQHLALKLVNLDENAEIEEFTDSEAARRKQKLANAQNLNMRGVFLHILSDAIGSVLTLVNAYMFLCIFPRKGDGKHYTSQNACFLRPGRHQSRHNEAGFKDHVLGLLCGNRQFAITEIEFCTPASFDTAAPKIRKVFHKHGIHSLTIQPIFSSNTCSNISPLPTHTLDVIKEDVSNSADTPLLNESQQ